MGNAASAGAQMALLSTMERQEAESIAREVKYIELSGHPAFTDVFSESILFGEYIFC